MYKALRAGVQDVAVKFLHRANADDLQKFIEVRASPRPGDLAVTPPPPSYGAAAADLSL